MSFLADGRQQVADEASLEAGPVVSPSHVEWLRGLLRDSPGAFDVFLDQTDHGVLRLEWQAALLGAGTAYLQLEGQPIASCLLLGGRYAIAERAAVDALQATLQSHNINGLKVAFDTVRRSSKPLRALFVTVKVRPEIYSHIQYWSNCLAAAYLESASSEEPPSPPSAYAG